MMKTTDFKTFLLLLFFLPGEFLFSQADTSELKISLKEAQEYALQNNKMIISAKLGVEESKRTVWESISAALPQVSTSGSFTDNLKLMTTLLPGEFFSTPENPIPAGTKIPITFGSQFNSNASITASLLLFNAPLYIGIETSKLASRLSEESLKKSESDTRESVATAYYLILVSEKSLEILEGNIANLNETLKSTRAMFSAGMAESTDVDQMISNVRNVENSLSALQRNIELNYNLLRFQLGLSPEIKLTLTETLESMTAGINVESILSQDFDHTRHIDYRLVEGQEMVSSMLLKSQKASVLPTLAGFYNYGTNGMGDKLNDLSWFPNSMIGVQLDFPLFASGQRYSKIKKAKISLDKATNTKDMVAEQLLIQEKQLRYNLVNANLQYQSQKENVDVARRVYASTENKFKQGMASSLDLTQANSLYLQAENNYVSALMNLLQTKLALDKLLNNI